MEIKSLATDNHLGHFAEMAKNKFILRRSNTAKCAVYHMTTHYVLLHLIEMFVELEKNLIA
jgi:hypothetical protein